MSQPMTMPRCFWKISNSSHCMPLPYISPASALESLRLTGVDLSKRCDVPRKRVAKNSWLDRKLTTTSGVRSPALRLYKRKAL